MIFRENGPEHHKLVKHPCFGIKHKPFPSDRSEQKWDPAPHPCCFPLNSQLGTWCQWVFGLLGLSSCILVCGLSPGVPQRAWPCPGDPLASARVPAACGLTPSAGSEISLHQVNCQTTQSLKLNIKAVACRRRAISLLLQQKAILAVRLGGRWIPRIGMEQPHSPGPHCCWGQASPEPQTVPLPEVSFPWYQKGW